MKKGETLSHIQVIAPSLIGLGIGYIILGLTGGGTSNSEYNQAQAAYQSGNATQGEVLEIQGQATSESSDRLLLLGVGAGATGLLILTRRPLSGEPQ